MKRVDYFRLFFAVALMSVTCGCVQYDRFNITDKPFVDKTLVELYIGEGAGERNQIQLKSSPADRQYTWSSLEPSVATVTQTGLVTAQSEGFAVIAISSDNDQTNINVRVRNWVPLEDVQILGDSRINKTRKDRFQLVAIPVPLDASECNIQWSSSNPIDFPVFENGWVICNEVGSAVITAKAGDIEQQVEVVVEKLLSVKMNKSGWSVPGYVDNSSAGTIGYSSQQIITAWAEDNRIVYLFDGDINTFWHSKWDPNPASDFPHWFIIDLGAEVIITDFSLYARQNYITDLVNGIEFFTCTEAGAINLSDPNTWAWNSHGEFELALVLNEQKFSLANPTARYIKVYMDKKFQRPSDRIMTGFAEIDVYVAITDDN